MSVEKSVMSFAWQLKVFAKNCRELDEIRQFRSHALYENGKRPEFGPNGKFYGDPDDLDYISYHLIANIEENNQIVGYNRITPCKFKGQCESIFGQTEFLKRLKSVNINVNNTYEAARWTIDENHRGSRLALKVAAIVGKIFIIEKNINIITAAGNCTKQADLLLKFMGGQVIDDNVFSDKYEDHISLIYFNKNNLKDYVYHYASQVSHIDMPSEI